MEGQKEGHPSWSRKQEDVEGTVGLQDLEVKARFYAGLKKLAGKWTSERPEQSKGMWALGKTGQPTSLEGKVIQRAPR